MNYIETVTPCKPFKKLNTLSKFLENDRKVLRFEGMWNDGLGKSQLAKKHSIKTALIPQCYDM